MASPIDAQFGTPGSLVRTLHASVYLKTGGGAVECHGSGLTLRQVDDVFAQVEAVDSYSPDARQSVSRHGTRERVPPG
ncbi:hypothetical protein ACWD69_26840 [Micromonospora chokoriensis]